MSRTVDRYPLVRAVCIMLAGESTDDMEAFLDRTEGFLGPDQSRLEDWLGTLSIHELIILATGEESEVQAVQEDCPLDDEGQPLSGIFEAIYQEITQVSSHIEHASIELSRLAASAHRAGLPRLGSGLDCLSMELERAGERAGVTDDEQATALCVASRSFVGDGEAVPLLSPTWIFWLGVCLGGLMVWFL